MLQVQGTHLCHFVRILTGCGVTTQPNVIWVAVIREGLPARWRVVWQPAVGGRAVKGEGGENAEAHHVPGPGAGAAAGAVT